MAVRKQRVAFIYDFDGTLSPGNMQEYDFIPKLNLNSRKFWGEVKSKAKEQQADEIWPTCTLCFERLTSMALE